MFLSRIRKENLPKNSSLTHLLSYFQLYHTHIQKSSTNCKHSTISNPQSPPFMQQPSAQIIIFSQPCPVKFNLFLRTHNFSHKSIRKCEKHSQNFFAKCETPNCSKISTSSVPFSTSPNSYQNYLKPNTFRAKFQQSLITPYNPIHSVLIQNPFQNPLKTLNLVEIDRFQTHHLF